jgi:membrane-associated phospholipid phosphatase
MTEILASQLPFIASLQNALASSSALVSFWKAVTILGNEEFFLLLISLVYWCISARRGLQLGVLVIGGDALNVLFKLLFAAPRPYWFGEPIRELSTDASFGMPSSHAQNALVVWLFLAYVTSHKYGRFRPYFVAAILIALISLSRVVLGVHFPTDILIGWIIGAAWLTLVARLWRPAAVWLRSHGFAGWALAAFGVLVFTFIVGRGAVDIFDLERQSMSGTFTSLFEAAEWKGIEATFARGGALFGLILGVALMLRGEHFDVAGTTTQKIMRFVLGFIGILVIWRGLAMVFPKGDDALALGFRFVRYALLTMWVVYFAPLVVSRSRLEKGISPLAAVD